MDFRTDQALVVYAEKFSIILWCISIMNNTGILYIKIIHGFPAVIHSTFKS